MYLEKKKFYIIKIDIYNHIQVLYIVIMLSSHQIENYKKTKDYNFFILY